MIAGVVVLRLTERAAQTQQAVLGLRQFAGRHSALGADQGAASSVQPVLVSARATRQGWLMYSSPDVRRVLPWATVARFRAAAMMSTVAVTVVVILAVPPGRFWLRGEASQAAVKGVAASVLSTPVASQRAATLGRAVMGSGTATPVWDGELRSPSPDRSSRPYSAAQR